MTPPKRHRCKVCNRLEVDCGKWHCPRCGVFGPPVHCSECERELRGERMPLSDEAFIHFCAEGFEMLLAKGRWKKVDRDWRMDQERAWRHSN